MKLSEMHESSYDIVSKQVFWLNRYGIKPSVAAVSKMRDCARNGIPYPMLPNTLKIKAPEDHNFTQPPNITIDASSNIDFYGFNYDTLDNLDFIKHVPELYFHTDDTGTWGDFFSNVTTKLSGIYGLNYTYFQVQAEKEIPKNLSNVFDLQYTVRIFVYTADHNVEPIDIWKYINSTETKVSWWNKEGTEKYERTGNNIFELQEILIDAGAPDIL